MLKLKPKMILGLETFMRVPSAITLIPSSKEVKEALAKIPGVYFDQNNPMHFPVMPLTPMSIQLAQSVALAIGAEFALRADTKLWYEQELKHREKLRRTAEHSQHVWDGRLRGYQNKGVSFMLSNGGRALLGDDPRLGKTPQSLITMDMLAGDQVMHVFTMKSLLDYWAGAVEMWLPHRVPVIVRGATGGRIEMLNEVKGRGKHGSEIFITNWETLRIGHEGPKKRKLKRQEPMLVQGKVPPKPKVPVKTFKYVIGDECHVVRGRTSAVGDVFVTMRPENVILASATMIERGPQDYFQYLKVLRPWEFRSYWRWVGWYCETYYNGFGIDIRGPKNSELMQEHLEPLSLRRKASETEGIPEKVFETVRVETSPEFDAAYEIMEKEVIAELTGAGLEGEDVVVDIPNELTKMVRLRQMSVAPRLLGLRFESPKIPALIEYIQSLGDMQVVVYCSFREAVKDIAAALEKAHVTCEVFMGGDKSPTAFLTGKVKALVSTPQVGGVGQDFSNADAIVYADLPLSATILQQSMWRTTKLGITKPRLIASCVATPIDNAIAYLLEHKQDAIEESDIYWATMKALRG